MIIKFIVLSGALLLNLMVFAQKDSMKRRFISPKYGFEINREKSINEYADSINKVTNVKNIPLFVFDECLEFDVALRKGFHSTESVRWEILQKVKNRKALNIILSSGDKRLKALCTKYQIDKSIKVNYGQMTFFDLIEKRLKNFK